MTNVGMYAGQWKNVWIQGIQFETIKLRQLNLMVLVSSRTCFLNYKKFIKHYF